MEDAPIPPSRMDVKDRARKRTQIATESATAPAEPDLAAIVDAWPTLPDAIKAGILATIEAAAR
jgi:hypothetical protein